MGKAGEKREGVPRRCLSLDTDFIEISAKYLTLTRSSTIADSLYDTL